MKKLIISLLIFIPSVACSKIEARVNEMLPIVRNIEIGLVEEFLVQNNPLPRSLSEIEFLNEIVKDDPARGILFNQLSVVSDAPVIIEAPGILRDHVNWRIFAIERTVNRNSESYKGADGEDMPGRYAVWISPDGTYCSPGWIPETEVQAIFKQIGGFDPSGQPLAFPQAVWMAKEKKQKILRDREALRELHRDGIVRRIKTTLTPKESSPHGSKVWGVLSALGILIVLVLTGTIYFLSRRP